MSKTKTPTEIQQATVSRVISKETGKVLGYLVKSDTQADTWYQVTWDRENHRYNCTCKATRPCKHERAVSEVVAARKAIEAEKKHSSQPVATDVEPAPQRYCDSCSCVGKLESIDGLLLCPTCAEATRPAISEPPAPVAPPTIATKRETAPLGSNKAFSLMR